MSGQMARFMTVNGKRIKCTVKVSLNGKTANSIKETSAMTSAKAKEFSHGEMVACMRVNGKTVNSTVKEFSLSQITQGEQESGRMAAMLNGSKRESSNEVANIFISVR